MLTEADLGERVGLRLDVGCLSGCGEWNAADLAIVVWTGDLGRDSGGSL